MRRGLRDVEPLAIGLAAVLFYAATGAREVLWGDPTKLTLMVHAFNLELSQWAHVGNMLLSWPFTALPVEPYAYRLHLYSALCAGVAMGFLHATLLAVGIARWPARVGTAAVAVAHTVWLTGAMYESYPLVLLCLALAGWLLVARGLPFSAGAALGLGALGHNICLFAAPALALGLWKAGRKRAVVAAIAGLALGWLVPTALMSSAGATGKGIGGWWEVVEKYADPELPLRNAPLLVGYAVYNLAGPALLLLGLGLRRIGARLALPALVFVGIHYAVAVFWMTQRAYLIPLPVYLAAAYPIALGAERLLERWRGRGPLLLGLTVACPVLVYAIAPGLYNALGLPRVIRDAPFREEARYFLRPWKVDELSARSYVDAIDGAAPQGALLVGDFILLTPIEYAQKIEGWRPDLAIYKVDHQEPLNIRVRIAAHLDAGGRVFLLDDGPDYHLEELAELGEASAVPGVESMLELKPQD